MNIWHYIMLENIPVVSLYFARQRPVVPRDGTWIMVDDDRFSLLPVSSHKFGPVGFARSVAIL